MHYHYMPSNSSAEAYSGAKMVQSTMTEMISNVSSQLPSAGRFELGVLLIAEPQRGIGGACLYDSHIANQLILKRAHAETRTSHDCGWFRTSELILS